LAEFLLTNSQIKPTRAIPAKNYMEYDDDCSESKVLLTDYNQEENGDFENYYSINTIIEHLGFGMFQIKLTFVVGLSWMADAIAITLLAVLGPAIQCYWNLTSEQTAMTSTCVFTGMFFGCWFWGWFCDKFGRKLAIGVCMVWICIWGTLSSLAPSHAWLMASMTLEGFGIGGVGQSMTVYSEFLPKAQRAAGLVFINIFYVLGSILSSICAYIVMPTRGWRLYAVLSTTPVFIFVFLLWWMPESPRFLVAAGKTEQAAEVLEKVACDNKKDLLPGRLKGASCDKRQPRGRLQDLFNDEHRRTTLILWFLWFTVIFSYYGVILFTAVLLNKEQGSCGERVVDFTNVPVEGTNTTHVPNHCHKMKPHDYLDYMYTSTGEIPGLVLTFVLAEKFGRRAAMALLFLCSAIMVSFLHLCLHRMSLVALIFTIRAFVTALVQAVYVYTPEVYPTNIRALAFGTASGMARLGAILTPFVSQVLLETSPHFAVGTYSGFMLICVAASLLLTKETKGKSLVEDEEDG